ncbi:hypothetical protein INT47_001902 [Mucor saturninus]|uniref:COX assembly mitochondrial protein n=1 Tax=Mucor saturninus TaxID=64648 RepID=A0A8H7VCT4_9FUNG|nr:hypothetical protein INT47_001902 [Mucor saturninus]
MSSNTARDYVESYVGESDDYLKTEQPRYDSNKPMAQPHTEALEADPQPEPVKASDHYKLHLRTQNPIPSTEKNDTPATTTATTKTSTAEKKEPVAVEWAVRDFKEQRNEIHETSLTICADLHEALFTCFKDGSWWDKAKMCEEQKQTFWKCYNTQKRFLKDVNYKGPVTSPEEDRRILQEAYKLRDKLDAKEE